MKWINKSILILFLVFNLIPQLDAQEELGNLWNRSETGMFLEENTSYFTEAIQAEENIEINYLFIPINLPIRDDFTKYRIKHFVNDTNDASVFDSLSYNFTVNGVFVDSLKYTEDTVYNYTYNPKNNSLDSNLAPILKVVFYLDSLDPFKISDTKFYFPNYSVTTQNGVSRTTFLQEDSTLFDTVYSHFFARDDANSLWINNGGYWNRTMSIDAPTIGVITLDGLNSKGKPYDNSTRHAYGQADEFSSKPINLYGDKFGRYTSSDSVFLSFFIQPQGNGDQPEVEDSILLEFYSPTENRWNLVWSKKGDTLQEFKKVFIHIADTNYLKVGFKFRFRNYATLSGNFDHWHLDYIQLAKSRKQNEILEDFAFSEPVKSFLKHYTSVPWLHYKENPDLFMKPKTIFKMRNLGPQTALTRSDYKVYTNGNINPFYISNLKVDPLVPGDDTFSIELPVNSLGNFFKFPVDTFERQLFRLDFRCSPSTGGSNQFNDTLTQFQLFDRFYSYDDGSAEKTFHLNLVGTTVVVEFNSPIEDTLRSVMINFVETFEPIDNQKINIVVYKDLESAPIYQSGPVDVIYNAEGKFYRYGIDPILIGGTFYVGYQQLGQEKTFLGYDVNFNNQSRTYVSQIDGDWNNSIFTGTTMIRASFGKGEEIPLSNEELNIVETENLNIYPNPAQDWVYFKEEINNEIEIYSIGGKLELREFVRNGINISHLPNGFYLVKANNFKTTKLIISR